MISPENQFGDSKLSFLPHFSSISDMVKEWPRRQAQTRAALKKERPLQEKVLTDVRKRVSQIEVTLKPALENSSLSSNTTRDAEETAHAVAKVR